LSVPVSAAYQCRLSVPSVPPHQCPLSVQPISAHHYSLISAHQRRRKITYLQNFITKTFFFFSKFSVVFGLFKKKKKPRGD
ncbi:unnamed protein product, partial [Staurois parvus]